MAITQASSFDNADQTVLTAAALAALASCWPDIGVNANGRFALIGAFQAMYISYETKLREALVRRGISSSTIIMLTDRDADGAWGERTARAVMAVLQLAALGAPQCNAGHWTIGNASRIKTAALAAQTAPDIFGPNAATLDCISRTSIVLAGVATHMQNRIRVVKDAGSPAEAVSALATFMRTPEVQPQRSTPMPSTTTVAEVTVSASNPSRGFFNALQAAAAIPNVQPLVLDGTATSAPVPITLGEEQIITAPVNRDRGLPTPIIVGGVIVGALAGVWVFKKWSTRRRR
jgi:hypothetical protein